MAIDLLVENDPHPRGYQGIAKDSGFLADVQVV
jgi:hypothetical protein